MENIFSVANKTALITGGTNGIGAMIAKGLVQAGSKVYIVGRNVEKGLKKANELSAMGHCEFIAADLSSLSGIEACVAAYSEKETSLDILVNNAGLLSMQGIEEVTEADWDGPMNINLKAVFFLTQKMLPVLRQAGTVEVPARVINIGSASGSMVDNLEYYAYGASKAALHHLTRTTAHNVANSHITVNAIAPGPFPSDIGFEPPQEVTDAILNGIPLKRWGAPEDIIGTVIYLASKAGSFNTGHTFALDGGMVDA